MRHVETPENRHIIFNCETLSFDCIEESIDPVVTYLEDHESISTTLLVKYWTQNNTYSQAHAYRIVNKSINTGMVKLKDGLLYIAEDNDEEENVEEDNGKYSINGYEYLVNIPIYDFTKEKYEKLEKEKNKKDMEYNSLEKIKIEEMWLNDLDQLKKHISE